MIRSGHEQQNTIQFGKRRVAPRVCVVDVKPHIRTFLADGPKLADGDAYKRAADAVDMGEKTRGFVYVDVDGVLPLAEQASGSLPPDASDAISAVDSFILEATGAGDVTKVSGFVRLND